MCPRFFFTVVREHLDNIFDTNESINKEGERIFVGILSFAPFYGVPVGMHKTPIGGGTPSGLVIIYLSFVPFYRALADRKL